MDSATQAEQPAAAQQIVILSRDGGRLRADVERVEGDRIWARHSRSRVVAGERIQVEQRVPGDARYTAEAKVELITEESLVLRRLGDWERDQRRANVRITTYGIDMIATPHCPDGVLSSSSRPRSRHQVAHSPRPLPMLDVSAGGTRFRASIPFGIDEEVTCHFELPGGTAEPTPLVVSARVVRVEAGQARREVGVEFLELTDEECTTITQWVFQEQLRRHRQSGQ